MRIIKSVKSDSTEQYFNAESFDTIQLNTTPIYLPKATNLLHKF